MTTHPFISFSSIPEFSVLAGAYPGLKALFFDMDGTLFDTERFHAEALQKIGIDHRIESPYTPEELHHLFVGKADHFIFEIIKSWKNFPSHWNTGDFVQAKNENLLGLLRASTSGFFPERTLELIAAAKERGLKVALVTSSEKVVTHEMLRIARIFDVFDHILTRNDCPRHKPDPCPYLMALEHFDLRPNEALIFEDSAVGLEAARLSGAHVAKVTWFDAP